MDDDTFKKELLTRLDTIIELLTSALPEACLEDFPPDQTMDDGETAKATALYQIDDEMQDDYAVAVQRWKQQERS